MSDGDIDVDVGDGLPIEVDLDSAGSLDVNVRSAPLSDVELTASDTIAALVSSAAPIDVQPRAVPATDVDTLGIDPIDVLVADIMGLTESEQARLFSKVFGEAPGKAPIEIWSVGEMAANGFTGDSIQWPITPAQLEIARGIIHAPLWRRRGYLDIDLSARFTNTSGVIFTAGSVKLETMPFPNSTFPEPWTTQVTMQLPGMVSGVGDGALSLQVRLRAAGHVGTVFTKSLSGTFLASDLVGGFGSAIGLFFLQDFNIDTSRHIAMRITCEATPAANQSLTVTGTNASLFNYQEPSGGN